MGKVRSFDFVISLKFPSGFPSFFYRHYLHFITIFTLKLLIDCEVISRNSSQSLFNVLLIFISIFSSSYFLIHLRFLNYTWWPRKRKL